MDTNLLLQLLQTLLPPIVVTLVTELVKKIKLVIAPKVIVGIAVPVISLVVSLLAYWTGAITDVWATFVVGLVGTFLYELKKQLTETPPTV